MRKFGGRVAIVVAACLLLGEGKAQAKFGIPDDVPASTLLYPFFKVDPTPSATDRQDSLIVITNTANPQVALAAVGSSAEHTWVHITVWSAKSQHVYDFSVRLTPHDVFSCSLLDLLVNPDNLEKPCGVLQAPLGVIDQLKVGDILVGYVTADIVMGPTSLFPGQVDYPFLDWNILVGHLYLVNLPAGSATGFNAVSIESVIGIFGLPGATFASLATGNANLRGIGHPAMFTPSQLDIGFYRNRCIEEQGPVANCLADTSPTGYDARERIDGPSGDAAQTFTAAIPVSSASESPTALLIRYFSAPALNGSSEVWLWKDRVTSGPAASVSVAVYDEDENPHSVTFALPDEVNFAKTADIISPGVPGGWFRIRFTCGPFGYCGNNPLDPTTWTGSGGTLRTPIQAVAYSLQFANSQDATLRWDAVFPSYRQYTDYIGGTAAE